MGLAWIPNPENKRCIDHINRDRTDNRLCNLRWATHTENNQNASVGTRNASGITGLCFDTRRNKWRVSKQINDVTYDRGFKERSDAELYLQQILGNL